MFHKVKKMFVKVCLRENFKHMYFEAKNAVIYPVIFRGMYSGGKKPVWKAQENAGCL